MPQTTPLDDTFGAVRAMLAAHVPPLAVRHEVTGVDYEVAAPRDGETFARVHRGADLVTLELPVLERDPNLLLKIGTALAACRGGTSNFTFTAPHARVFEDVARLLAAGAAPYAPRRRR